MPVLVRSRLRRPRLVEVKIRRLAERILTQVKGVWELSLDLVGDRRMRRLNRQYRGRDAPTDVLAFPMRTPTRAPRVTRHVSRVMREEADAETRRGGDASISASPCLRVPVSPAPVMPEMLGDVVISVHTAARQADVLGHTLEEELAVLLIHGILHLCGYDHERGEREANRMRRKERAILRSLGTLPKLVRQQGGIQNAK